MKALLINPSLVVPLLDLVVQIEGILLLNMTLSYCR